MHDHVDAGERLGALRPVADVAHPHVGPRRRARRGPVGVDLGVQAVEDADLVAGGQEAIDEERADEPGPAGYQDSHRASAPAGLMRSAGTT